MNSKILIGIIAIVVIVGAVILLGNGKKDQGLTPANNNNGAESIPTTQSQPIQVSETVNIEVTSSGFSTASVKVKPGAKIVWNNKSGADISVNSDDHPTHRLYKALNLGHIPNGSSVSLLFDKPGTYKYHDHYHPERTGTIVVE